LLEFYTSQVVSAPRIALDSAPSVDLLILDELESIFSQVSGYLSKGAVQSRLVELLRVAKHIVAGDAFLDQNSTRTLAHLARKNLEHDATVVLNAFPAFPVALTLREFKLKNPRERAGFVETVDGYLRQELRVCCPIASRRLVESLRDLYTRGGADVSAAEEAFAPEDPSEAEESQAEDTSPELEETAVDDLAPSERNAYNFRGLVPCNVAVFTGHDFEVSHGKSMYRLKAEAFADINAFIRDNNVDLLLWTSTMTAGVSIDLEWFDVLVGAYSSFVSPLFFAQSMCRVRRIRSNSGVLFIEHTGTRKVQTAAGLLHDSGTTGEMLRIGFDTQPSTQLDIWTTAREDEINGLGWRYLIQSLAQRGFTFDTAPRAESSAKTLTIGGKPAEHQTELAFLDEATDPQAVAARVLTNEDLEIFARLGHNERAAKMDIHDATYEVAAVKIKLMNTLALTLEEANTLPAETIKDMQAPRFKSLVKRFIERDKAAFAQLDCPAKIQLIAELKAGKQPTAFRPAAPNLRAEDLAAALAIRENLGSAAFAARQGGTSSAGSVLVPAAEAQAVALVDHAAALLIRRGGAITVDTSLMRRAAKDRTLQLPELESQVLRIAATVKTGVSSGRQSAAGRATNPLGKIKATLAAAGCIFSEETKRSGRRGAQSYKVTLTAPAEWLAEVTGEEVDKARAEKGRN
jgi:hypothetical protein